ncbi:unnamed protein product [Urochloa humidicola]
MSADIAPQPKKVCVVGAGMSGLAAARELRREGHAVTVMEQCGDVGGQWLYDPRTDTDDPLGAATPVKVHGSMYASVRLISPRECMGFSDFQFVPRPTTGDGRDARRFPGRQEVYCYLKDFCTAFRLADAVRFNTRVLRVSMAPPPPPREESGAGVRWLMRSVRVEPDGGEEGVAAEEVFDAVVVANGHYSQPRLPKVRVASTRQKQSRFHPKHPAAAAGDLPAPASSAPANCRSKTSSARSSYSPPRQPFPWSVEGDRRAAAAMA